MASRVPPKVALAVVLAIVAVTLLALRSPVAETATDAAAAPAAAADTYVKATRPRANFGASGKLVVDNAPKRRTVIRFTVADLTGSVTSAKLRLHVLDVSNGGSKRGGTLRSMSDSTWSEDAVTWNAQPAIDGATLGSLGAVSRNTWYQIDVTAAVAGNGTFSFGLTSASSDGAYYDSRESGANAPQLVVVTAPGPTPDPTQAASPDQVLVGAGDIASCGSSGDEATATLLDGIAGTVFTLGDNVYPNGSSSEYSDCYESSWGRHKSRTRPAPGNHEYGTLAAAGYFGYFGAAAGDPAKGYYSYDLGSWHVVVVNSSCAEIGGCGVGSAQEQWLRQDLAANTLPCTMGYWHHPLFTSGHDHNNATEMRPIFQALYDAKAEVVVSGHNHNYERFAPQDPNGNRDNASGIREFVAGTGGFSHYGFGTIQSNSEVRNANTFGVLKLTLRSNGYDWQFVPTAGGTFTDSGTATCH